MPESAEGECETCLRASGVRVPKQSLSEFLKRALAQTCLRAWYQARFFRPFLGILGALCMGKGAPLVRYLCTTWESVHMFFTEMCPSGGTKYISFELFLSILRKPGEGRGGAPGTVPLQNPEVTSRKACLRNADSCTVRNPVSGCFPGAKQGLHGARDSLGTLGPKTPKLWVACAALYGGIAEIVSPIAVSSATKPQKQKHPREA